MAQINTFEVSAKPELATDIVSALEETLRDIGIQDARAFSTSVYTIDGKVDVGKLTEIAKLVSHELTQDVYVNAPLHTAPGQNEQKWDFAVRIDFKPGVTDNAARVLKADLMLVGVEECDVYTSRVHYITGEFNPELRDMLERVASNPQIHDIRMLTREDFDSEEGFENRIHPVKLGSRPDMFWINLSEMSHEELLLTGKKGTLNTDTEQNPRQERGGTLALAEDYMLAIKAYAESDLNTKCAAGGREKGTLTDTEMEVLAQMWSEHCRHSLLKAIVPGVTEKGIFDEYIKKPTLKVLKEKPHLGLSVYKDNSGVFWFNNRWLAAIKNETHNSPSALDPYGGAITGIVGVNRDPAGTGLGGEDIANFLFYFFGQKDDRARYYKSKTLETLLLNPKQIYDGVNKGVEDGGNQMGIPINQGICTYDRRYNGKPIVGVGTIGRLPHKINGKPSYEKHIDAGDRLYIVGGRAGMDGIHGATFSSEGLTENSPATAVQIGDAYTQRKLFEALLELRDRGYIKYVTDLGAGGTSCAALEMAEETGGIEIDLDKLLIKYAGMTATELFLNESQERMAIAVDENNKDEIEAILRKHEVEFSDIGIFTNSGRAIVHCKGERVVDLDMNFINIGYPARSLNPKEYRLTEEDKQILRRELGLWHNSIPDKFKEMHKRPNLGSVAPFMDRMDSSVKGLSAQHCIQGSGRVSGNASCIKVDISSDEGLIQSYGHTERQSYIDSEKMGKNSFLRSIGHNIAMGGRLDHMAATDQALWQSSDDPKYQQMLVETFRGMSEVIEGCKIPVISGKDSMYNQATIYDEEGKAVQRGVFPTLLMTTLAKIDDVSDIATIDAKQDGDLVYVVGSATKQDLGGSEYYNMFSEKAGIEFNIGRVSDEDIADVFETYNRMNNANREKLLQSAVYIGKGGLAIALRDTAMAGGKGIYADVAQMYKEFEADLEGIMYGETEGRFLVTVRPEDRGRFEALFSGRFWQIGNVKDDRRLKIVTDNAFGKKVDIVDEHVEELLKLYHNQ